MAHASPAAGAGEKDGMERACGFALRVAHASEDAGADSAGEAEGMRETDPATGSPRLAQT